MQPTRSWFVVFLSMAEFSIEGNGRLERTAVYYNGEQLDQVREVFLNIDEEGAFDAVIMYLGADGKHYTRNIFVDYLDSVRTEPPGFTEEEARELTLFSVVSNGDVEETILARNGEELEGVVSLFVHIKAPSLPEGTGLRAFFGDTKSIPDAVEFKAEITFREENGTLSTERIF